MRLFGLRWNTMRGKTVASSMRRLAGLLSKKMLGALLLCAKLKR